MGALTFFLIAGEPSGDKLGAALMAGLRQLHPTVTFSGIGGPLMQAQGMTSLFPMEELSVMGLAEVLPKYFPLTRRIAQAAEAAVAESGALNHPNKFGHVLPLAGVCGGGGDGDLVRWGFVGRGGDMLAGPGLRIGLGDRSPIAPISS